MEKRPWLDYAGQTTSELIACKNTHSMASLLCAFEWGIQAKAGPGGEDELTRDERLVLAVMALQREVNNGGYSQFFTNSSRRFASIIVESLRRIGCVTTGAITTRSIAALGVQKLDPAAVLVAALNADSATSKILDALDKEFYQIDEIEHRLFEFVETHQSNIQLQKGSKPPFELKRPERSNAARLSTSLNFAKLRGVTLEELREPARQVARQKSIEATDVEVDAALTLYLFDRSLRKGDVAACELLAPEAFKLMREDTTHCILHKKWVLRLINEARLELADKSALYYLEYLRACDQSDLSTQNRILFWAAVLQENGTAALLTSARFFVQAFPELDLNKPLPASHYGPVKAQKPLSRPN
jgi:Domain of unknown function (DUF4375)